MNSDFYLVCLLLLILDLAVNFGFFLGVLLS